MEQGPQSQVVRKTAAIPETQLTDRAVNDPLVTDADHQEDPEDC